MLPQHIPSDLLSSLFVVLILCCCCRSFVNHIFSSRHLKLYNVSFQPLHCHVSIYNSRIHIMCSVKAAMSRHSFLDTLQYIYIVVNHKLKKCLFFKISSSHQCFVILIIVIIYVYIYISSYTVEHVCVLHYCRYICIYVLLVTFYIYFLSSGSLCLLCSNSSSACYLKSPSPPSSFKLNTLYKTCRLTFTRLTTAEEMAKSMKVHYWSFDSITLNQSLNHSLAFPELSTTSHGLWQHKWPRISEGYHRQWVDGLGQKYFVSVLLSFFSRVWQVLTCFDFVID